jgi:DNA-binding MarR family transcriptional regulator
LARGNGSAAHGADASNDTALVEVLDSIRYIIHTLRVAGRAAEQSVGVSGAQLYVLQQLAKSPAQSLNELAARTLTHQSSVSVVVSRLVERRLVARSTSPDDGRRIVLTLTPAGRSLLARAPEAAQARLTDGLRRLPERETRALARSLRSLVTTMARDGDGRGESGRAKDL